MKKPYLILTSEQVSQEYLRYLDGQNISWIACGKGKIDLPRACGILAEEFGVKRMSIVGGPAINTAFLNDGLPDEISPQELTAEWKCPLFLTDVTSIIR